jgi:hypothetical protein
VGSSTRKLRRAAGLTGYEYQRDLKRAHAARRRADRALGLTVTPGPNTPPPIPRKVYRAEDATITVGDTSFDGIFDATVEPCPPLLIIDDPIVEPRPAPEPARRRASALHLLALVSMLGMGLGGRDRG